MIDAYDHVPAKTVSISAVATSLRVGATVKLKCTVSPANATRKNIIWESSAPSIASIDKFGVVTAHATGNVNITAYSWRDADPQANDSALTYRRDGIQDSLAIELL